MAENIVPGRDGGEPPPPPWLKWGLLAALVAVFAGLFAFRRPPVVSAGFAIQPAPAISRQTDPVFEQRFVCGGETSFVHSTTVVHLGDGRLRAFWLGGDGREGQPDVKLFTSVFDPEEGVWSPQAVLITREAVRSALHRNIITLGNPVVVKDAAGRLMLWFVSVSMGGWSGSAINLIVSEDEGATWTPPERLITSPFFNLATLVKGPAFFFQDGTIGLPVYHECIGKFAELLRLDPDGRLRHKQRLSFRRWSLQPTIVPRTADDATCFLRRAGDAPRRGITIATEDGGRTWTAPKTLDMQNSGAPVGAIRLASGEMLLAFNDHVHGRETLTLAITADEGETYHTILADTEAGEDKSNFADGLSYPCFIRDDEGDFHLFYTWHRQRIRHVRFNQAWLDERQ